MTQLSTETISLHYSTLKFHMLNNDWGAQRYEVVNHRSLLFATIRTDKSIKARTSLPLLDWSPHSNFASQLVIVSNTLSFQSARYRLRRIQRTDRKEKGNKLRIAFICEQKHNNGLRQPKEFQSDSYFQKPKALANQDANSPLLSLRMNAQ